MLKLVSVGLYRLTTSIAPRHSISKGDLSFTNDREKEQSVLKQGLGILHSY